ncbi:MAG: ABC transporter ATP-binding protein [Planctomycetota bacterium]
MNQPIIQVSGLGKRYQIGTYDPHETLRERIMRTLTSPWRRLKNLRGQVDESQTIWALRDVSFDVKKGEVLGIIGRNGAGKSTLLKILSRITDPTEGEARLRGRVGALIEVGTGFHPELTGRENVFLNGAILGMTRRDIRARFDEIVAFAEVERYIDTPVKHYSSGMRLRLAFAVAAHLEPEILIIDEVLAVGDAAFQKKCLTSMSDKATSGRTVLFVSHNMEAVRNLCSRCILLDEGQVLVDGQPDAVITAYLHDAAGDVMERIWTRDDAPGSAAVQLLACRIVPEGSPPPPTITVRTAFRMELDIVFHEPFTQFHLNVQVCDASGTPLFPLSSVGRAFDAGDYRFTCKVPGSLLNNGLLSVNVMLVRNGNVVVHREIGAIHFEVGDDREGLDWYGPIRGVLRPQWPWTVDALSASRAVATREGS